MANSSKIQIMQMKPEIKDGFQIHECLVVN